MRKLVLIALFSVTASAQTFDRFSVHASGGMSIKTWHGQAAIPALNIEIGRALTPRMELAFVFAPMYIRQPRSWFGDQFGDGDENVSAVSGSLLVRHRFREHSNRAAMYLEASTGPMWAERRVPAATSRFNFISQFGAGFELRPQSRTPIVIGYRFGHISNGGYAPRNPGWNVSSLVIGTRFRTATSRRP